MNDYIKVPTTREVWAVMRASHGDKLRVFSSFSDPDGTFQGGPGERGVMETGYGLEGTDFPILWARSDWDIVADGKRDNESHKYWLCVARRQE